VAAQSEVFCRAFFQKSEARPIKKRRTQRVRLFLLTHFSFVNFSLWASRVKEKSGYGD
jgi:hypothetical protein